MDHINPPAVVCQDIEALTEECKSIHDEIAKGEKTSLAKAVRLGAKLERLKEQCDYGKYIPRLEKIGISRKRAWEFRQFAKCPPVDISNCESIADARRLVTESEPEETSPSAGDYNLGYNRPPFAKAYREIKESEPEADLNSVEQNRSPETVKPALPLCMGCQKHGAQKGCPQCKKFRKRIKAEQEQRIEGGDTESLALPKSVANALADTWHLENARILSVMSKQVKSAISWSVYLDGGVLDALKLAEEYFLSAAPRKACDECDGQKKIDGKPCQRCRASGYLASQV